MIKKLIVKMHDPRLSRTIEDVYREIGTIVEGRNYLILEVGAATDDEGIDDMRNWAYLFQQFIEHIFIQLFIRYILALDSWSIHKTNSVKNLAKNNSI